MTISLSCLLGDCSLCDGLAIIDNETWQCQHECHEGTQ